MQTLPTLSRFALVLLLIAARHAQSDTFVRDDIILDPTPHNFSVCFDHHCASLETLSLKPAEWRSVTRLFTRAAADPAADPAVERKRIAQAIAQLEQLTGKYTGTSNDKGGDLKGLGQNGQMDCIDESINTTTYLRLLESSKLMRWHSVEDRATRGWFIRGWPHTAAVIKDKRDGQQYVVDSWFQDNGQPPFILSLEEWKSGWDPEKDPLPPQRVPLR